MGIQKRVAVDAAVDVFIYIHIYIHWNIIRTFSAQFGNWFSFLQLLVAALSLLELVCACKLPGDRAESSEITWQGQFLELFPYFLMQSHVTVLSPSKHGNGSRKTLACLLLKIIDWIGTELWIQEPSWSLCFIPSLLYSVCLQMKNLARRTGASYAKPIMYSVVHISEWAGAETGWKAIWSLVIPTALCQEAWIWSPAMQMSFLFMLVSLAGWQRGKTLFSLLNRSPVSALEEAPNISGHLLIHV